MMQADPQCRADSVSFRQLKLFESIARLNSVRKASEDCNLSQPAVTQALAKLEQLVGITLVERRASGSYLNEYGRIFYDRATRFFAQVEAALVELGTPGGQAGTKLIARRISRSQVRSLIAIIETGAFDKAAEVLDLSQASLQRAARDLEGNLRKPLFYRTAAGMMVTPAGAEFGKRMKLAIQEIEWGIREIEAVQGSFASEFVIGAMSSGGSVLLASVLEEFMQAYPQVDVRIINKQASAMIQALRAGDVDFVLGLLPEVVGEDLHCEAFARTPYSIVARRQHPILRKGKVTIEELLSYDWVVGTAGSNRRACFDRLFAHRRGPKASVATCALTVIRHLLARSDRLTLMTSYELMHEEDCLAALPFGPIEPVPTIGVTMRANWLPTRLHTDFFDILKRHTATAPVDRVALRQVG